MTVDLATLRDRLDLAVTVVSDEELAEILDACTEQQNAVVLRPDEVTGTGSVSLDRALIRRCAREIAAKGLPLGAQATEYGTFYLPGRSDPITQGLEVDHLRGGFA